MAYGQTGSTIFAWGDNDDGQCDVPAPNVDFISISGGARHVLGLKSDGSVVGWGSNNYGQCDAPSPNSDFIAISAGYNHSMGLKSDGTIIVWGSTSFSVYDIPLPNVDFIAIAAGDGHCLGLKSNGQVVAWGSNNYGECIVPGPNSDFIAIGGSIYHCLGLKSDGSIVAWGLNSAGQCNVPLPNEDFTAIAGGYQHSMGLKSDGSIVVWGDGDSGQRAIPTPNEDFVAIAAGVHHCIGLKSDGALVAWGYNVDGQCDVPEPNIGFEAIAGGHYYSLSLRKFLVEPVILTITDVDNDQGRQIFLDWQHSIYDQLGSTIPIVQYEIFRKRDLGEKLNEAGSSAENIPLRISAATLPDGIWDYITAVPAHGEELYYIVAPTLADYTETSGIVWSEFLIRAATADPYTYFDSGSASGYSIDNIVPPAPTGMAVAYGVTNALNWETNPAPDLAWFNVYRSTTPDFDPTPENLIHQTQSLEWIDPEGTWGYHYLLIAVDDAGNRSDPVSPDQVSGMQDGDMPDRMLLLAASPNPFNPHTTIFCTIAEAGHIDLSIYDVSGRLVKTLVDSHMDAGEKKAEWNGTDSSGKRVASGTYFLRLETDQGVRTRKVMLAK
jgi:Regulator of chromosome condensation (RCC1) repeat/FlgD Ig-like domain